MVNCLVVCLLFSQPVQKPITPPGTLIELIAWACYEDLSGRQYCSWTVKRIAVVNPNFRNNQFYFCGRPGPETAGIKRVLVSPSYPIVAIQLRDGRVLWENEVMEVDGVVLK